MLLGGTLVGGTEVVGGGVEGNVLEVLLSTEFSAVDGEPGAFIATRLGAAPGAEVGVVEFDAGGTVPGRCDERYIVTATSRPAARTAPIAARYQVRDRSGRLRVGGGCPGSGAGARRGAGIVNGAEAAVGGDSASAAGWLATG
ncbi:hypothetical protein [Frankia sp. AgW1.1]|uniref:hypothetical protein n=1 Tax=Frankia sp. AgW1.1 TaxID=1836971 RepID=UPI001933304A|nr:hypothetical protein [Frankia sp. AgW1.1]